jgi:hypothetical protein
MRTPNSHRRPEVLATASLEGRRPPLLHPGRSCFEARSRERLSMTGLRSALVSIDPSMHRPITPAAYRVGRAVVPLSARCELPTLTVALRSSRQRASKGARPPLLHPGRSCFEARWRERLSITGLRSALVSIDPSMHRPITGRLPGGPRGSAVVRAMRTPNSHRRPEVLATASLEGCTAPAAPPGPFMLRGSLARAPQHDGSEMGARFD